ncbi:MAG: glycosyltransferase [Patescibacteria group bacterium]|nr:MAG: glycosyltransferase [Patescibacteria group bacterium]
MRVLFFPYSDLNPYQQLLAAGLRDAGIEASFDKKLFRLRSFWPKPSFDLLHLHWLPGDLPRMLLLLLKLTALRLLKVPVVWTVHNLTHHQRSGRFDLLGRRIVARVSNLLICHCENAGELVAGVFGIDKDKIAVVPHGNYIGVYPGEAGKAAARRKLGLPQDGLVFLVFGIAMRRKGFPSFVKEFKKLKSPATLIYAGKMADPVLQRQLEELQKGTSNIKYFFGYVPDSEVSVFFAAADCVAVTYEGALTSGTIALAASFGKAVAAPAVGCIPEQLDQGGNLLYNPKETGALLKALEQAFQEDLEALGRKNYDKVEKMTWKKIARRTARVYEEAFNKNI